MPENIDKQFLKNDQHDHQGCIDTALQHARTLCIAHSVKLTPTREQVLKLVWDSHKPIGAYTIMEALAELSKRRVAPPTVYRALDFLLDLGLIHRINSLNAFIGCTSPDSEHHNYFLICESCKLTVELDPEFMQKPIDTLSQTSGFEIKTQSLELMGLCPNCINQQTSEAT